MIEFKHRSTGSILYTSATSTDVKSALMEGLKAGANLRYADLRYADLRYADLRSVDLSYVDLRYADLRYADLRSANLSSADLRSAKTIGEIKCNGKMIQISNVCEWGPMVAYMTTENKLYIWIGCQHKPYAEMVKHWRTRADRPMSRVALKMAQIWFKEVSK